MEYKKCFVPSCKNDSVNSPDKIIVKIRQDLREQWCKAANTDFFRIYTIYCCEDHFDPEKDLKNFRTFKKLNTRPVLKSTAQFRFMSKSQPAKSAVKSASGSSASITAEKKRAIPKAMSEFSKACRCCLLKVGAMKPIFGSSLDAMLTDLMGFKIKRNDGYPQQICTRCIRKLSAAHNFYQTVNKSHRTVEVKCNVLKRANAKESFADFAIRETGNEEMNEETTVTVSVSCQTEDKFFQKLMLANVQLSRIEPDSSYDDMPDAEYVMLSENEDDDLPEAKYVRVASDDGEMYEELPDTKYGYKCPQCLHVSSNQEDLKEHMETHLSGAAAGEGEDTPAQLCNICGQTFKCRTSLYKHLRFHNGYVFECKYCDKQFAEQSTLRVHMITHSLTNAKPFDCDACERSFTQKAALKKHVRALHSEQRAVHHCKHCDRSFLYKHSLNKHCLRHHTISKCNLCDSQFSGVIELEKHVKSHKKEKPLTFEAEYLEFDEL